MNNLFKLDGSKIYIGVCPERVQTLKFGIQAKRKQYGLKHRIASTIHIGMGQDLTHVVTRVCSMIDDSAFALWEKEQAVVLMSRTNFAKQIIFVGDKKKTSAALAALLNKHNQYSRFTEYFLGKLCQQTSGENPFPSLVIEQQLFPFRPKDVDIPNGDAGFVYMLLSLRDYETFYIGQTKNLAVRLNRHNDGLGSSGTKDVHLRPWGVFGFITGFKENTKQEREKMEAEWKYKIQRLKMTRGLLNAEEAFDFFVGTLSQDKKEYLVCVKCGTMLPQAVDVN